jgi:hypothetical protein
MSLSNVLPKDHDKDYERDSCRSQQPEWPVDGLVVIEVSVLGHFAAGD